MRLIKAGKVASIQRDLLKGESNVYAVIETGGKQYRVSEGDILEVEKLSSEENETVEFSQVVMGKDGEAIKVGNPYLKEAKVTARVLRQGRGKKITVFKYKPKKNYRRKKGHRQPFSRVRIENISLG